MESLETLARRIEVTTSLRSVVRTMKSLSLVKVRHFEHAQRAIRIYERTVELGLQAILLDKPPAYAGPTFAEQGRTGIVIIGSDHGLCGRFNEDVVRFAHGRLRSLGRRARETPQLAVGERVAYRLESIGHRPRGVIDSPSTVAAITAATDKVLVAVEGWRSAEDVDRVLVYHNAQSGGHTCEPREVSLLPVSRSWLQTIAARPWPARGRPMHSMDSGALLTLFLRQHLFVQIYRSIAQSLVSEHVTRLGVMQTAEGNIRDKLAEMGSEFRRVRQESITSELLDAVSGYEAMRPRR